MTRINNYQTRILLLCLLVFLFPLCSAPADEAEGLANAVQKFSSVATNNVADQKFPQPGQNQTPDQTQKTEDTKRVNSNTYKSLTYDRNRYGLLTIIAIIFSAISLVIVTLYRTFSGMKKALEKRDLINFCKDFTHARLLQDPHGLAAGRFRIEYPHLRVGEFTYSVKGGVLEGRDLLHLRGGKTLHFYSDLVLDQAPVQRKAFGYLQDSSQKTQSLRNPPSKIVVKKSIFD